MNLTPAICYRALLARDARYDGRFFTCVRTTKIYCRPICPARPPKFENCTFVPTAAAAQHAGYRPCLRCRPESSPDLDAWQGTSATVSRALKLIEAGTLDSTNIDSLAARLHITPRHLRRLFQQHIGAAPITVAQTRRVLLAKQLLHQTDLPMVHVALASGFGSVRRFNETFQRLYHRPPRELRRGKTASTLSPEISLLLPYRPPYDWPAMLNFLQRRTITGLEHVTTDSYSRVISLNKSTGTITISHAPQQNALRVLIRFPKLSALSAIIARIRRMFDLSADPIAIATALSADPLLAPLIAKRPGLRVPGGWNGFEIAIRAILGQQITVKAATNLASRILTATGKPLTTPHSPHLTHAFPRPENFTSTALENIGMPGARAAALLNIAKSIQSDPHLFDHHPDLDHAIAHLRKLPGIGEWTANYIAMRAMSESDAFLAGDVALQKKFTQLAPTSPIDLLTHANRWRPWRAYAVMHLWHADTETNSETKTKLNSKKPSSLKEPAHAIAS